MGNKHKQSVVPSTLLPSNEKLRFSFEYYDKTSSDFCLSRWTQTQIREALLRLQDICTKTFNDLTKERYVYHFGEVIWEETIKKSGFPDSRVNQLPAFHFALLGVNGQKTRVYGAYSMGIFYVVWFDLNHDIWPVQLRHT